MITIVVISAVIGSVSSSAEPFLEERVSVLEKEVAELKAALGLRVKKSSVVPKEPAAASQGTIDQQKSAARNRAGEDLENYSKSELREIEALYQVANKKWRTEEGKESLEKLIDTYDKANRTGCALLYLGQMSTGDERVQYLEQAIVGFSDCFYGNGVQVGAYARFYLAWHYKKAGDASKASELFSEVDEQYPDAIDHKGNLLAKLMNR